MDRWTALGVFKEIAERGSLAEAGRRLSLSPSAISKNLAELEAQLGTRLVQRTTRRLALTEAGRRYLDAVQGALGVLDAAEQDLRHAGGEVAGLLRVSAPMTLTLLRLSERIPAFLSAHPALRLDLHLDDRRVDLVREGFDLALRGSDSLEEAGLIAKRLTVLPHVLCASPAYLEAAGRPETPADLKRHECIRFSLSGHADQWTFEKDGRRERVAIQGRYKVGSSLAVRDALLAGFGISLIPFAYVERDVAAGRLVALLAGWTSADAALYAVHASRRFVPPKVRGFIDFVTEVFAQ